MLRIAAAAFLILPVPALAQQATPARAAPAADTQADMVSSNADQQAESGRPPQRIRSVTLTGNDACPKARGADEVVVCSRIAPGEQFRVPKSLRQSKPSAANNSWVNRAATLDEVGRRAGGLPDTCSPVGSGGQSGCALKANQDYAAERAARKRDAADIP